VRGEIGALSFGEIFFVIFFVYEVVTDFTSDGNAFLLNVWQNTILFKLFSFFIVLGDRLSLVFLLPTFWSRRKGTICWW